MLLKPKQLTSWHLMLGNPVLTWKKRGSSLNLVWCCQKLPHSMTLPSLGSAPPEMPQGDGTRQQGTARAASRDLGVSVCAYI